MKNLLLWARLLHIYIWNTNLSAQKTRHVNWPSAITKPNVMHAFSFCQLSQDASESIGSVCRRDVPMWSRFEREKERRCGKDESFTLFSNDWFNLIFCVDLFTHLTYMLYFKRIAGIALIINSKAVGMSVTMRYTHKFRTWLNINLLYRDLWNTIPWLLQNFSRSGNCCCKISLLFQVFHDRTNPIKATDARFQSLKIGPLPPLIICRICYPVLFQDLSI